jgi:hypothetical protein
LRSGEFWQKSESGFIREESGGKVSFGHEPVQFDKRSLQIFETPALNDFSATGIQ